MGHNIPHTAVQNGRPIKYTSTGWVCLTLQNQSNPGMAYPRSTPWTVLDLKSLSDVYEPSLEMAQQMCAVAPQWNWGQEPNMFHRKNSKTAQQSHDHWAKPPANKTEAWARYHCISAHGNLKESGIPHFHRWSGGHYPIPRNVGSSACLC